MVRRGAERWASWPARQPSPQCNIDSSFLWMIYSYHRHGQADPATASCYGVASSADPKNKMIRKMVSSIFSLTGSLTLHLPLRGVLLHHTLARRTTRRLRAAYVIGMAASLHR